MSGAQSGLPLPVTNPVPGTNPHITALMQHVARGAHTVGRLPQTVRNTATPIVQGVGSHADAGWTAIKDAASSTKQHLKRLAQAAQTAIDEQKEYTTAAGERFFDPTAIALELSGIGGGAASQFARPVHAPYFSFLPGSAAVVEVIAYITGEKSGGIDINGKPNPVLLSYYAYHQMDPATLRQGNDHVHRYFQNRHTRSAQGAAAGFVAVVSGLIQNGQVGPFLNAGIHAPSFASTGTHLVRLIYMRNQSGLDARLKPWLDLLIEIKAAKALIRANLMFLSLPFTDQSVWYQLMGASTARMTYRPRIVGACCVAAADLHARAYIEQGHATAAPAPANSNPGRLGPRSINRAVNLPAPVPGAAALHPATDIIVELFSKYGGTGTTNPFDIIKAPAGWLAIANKMMLL